MFKSITEIKKGDTVRLIADRGIREITYQGVALNDYNSEDRNPGISLTMAKTGKQYYMKESGFGLRLTSWKGTSLCNVAEYGHFID